MSARLAAVDVLALERLFDSWHARRMSGGMGRRPWSAPTLADRSRVCRGDDRDAGERSDRAALTAHCWVLDAPGSVDRHPGLLLEWRRQGRNWLGLVAYVQREDHERIRLIQRWLPAELLQPVDQP